MRRLLALLLALPAAPLRAAEPPPNLVGVFGGLPYGLGLYTASALNKSVSGGIHVSVLNVAVSDINTLFQLGGRLRWHWKRIAPRGPYLFAELAYLKADFKDSGAALEERNEAVKPTFGIGYQSRTQPSFDFGFGVGTKARFKRRTATTDYTLTLQSSLYAGLAYAF